MRRDELFSERDEFCRTILKHRYLIGGEPYRDVRPSFLTQGGLKHMVSGLF